MKSYILSRYTKASASIEIANTMKSTMQKFTPKFKLIYVYMLIDLDGLQLWQHESLQKEELEQEAEQQALNPRLVRYDHLSYALTC